MFLYLQLLKIKCSYIPFHFAVLGFPRLFYITVTNTRWILTQPHSRRLCKANRINRGSCFTGAEERPQCCPSDWGSARHKRFILTGNMHQRNRAAAAAAKSLQSCPTLCDPMDGSPPGSPVPGILQARTLEWAAIFFSNAWKWKVKVKSLSRVRLPETPWSAAYQAPPSIGFSRQEYWSEVPLHSPKKPRDTRNKTMEVEISATYWPSVEQQATEPRAGEASWWKPSPSQALGHCSWKKMFKGPSKETGDFPFQKLIPGNTLACKWLKPPQTISLK